MKKKNVAFTIIAFIIFSGIFVIYFYDNLKPISNDKRVFAWFYGFEGYETAEISSTLKEYGITDLFLSVYTRAINTNASTFDEEYDTKLKDFIQDMEKQKIKVTIMTLEDPIFIYNWNDAQLHLEGIADFLKRYPDLTITGIHLDVEPHATEEWSDSSFNEQKEIFSAYLDLLMNVSQFHRLYYPHLELSAAVPWWYNEQNYSIAYPTELVDRYSFLVFMVYDGVGSILSDYQKIEDEMVIITSVLGIGVHEFKSTEDCKEFGITLLEHYSNYDNFLGISYYSMNKLI